MRLRSKASSKSTQATNHADRHVWVGRVDEVGRQYEVTRLEVRDELVGLRSAQTGVYGTVEHLRRCGKGVKEVWRRCGGGVEEVWKRCGGGVEEVWKRCG